MLVRPGQPDVGRGSMVSVGSSSPSKRSSLASERRSRAGPGRFSLVSASQNGPSRRRLSRLSGNVRQSMISVDPGRTRVSTVSGVSGIGGHSLGRPSQLTLGTLQSQMSHAELASTMARRISRVGGGGQRSLVPGAAADAEETMSVLFFDNDVEDGP